MKTNLKLFGCSCSIYDLNFKITIYVHVLNYKTVKKKRSCLVSDKYIYSTIMVLFGKFRPDDPKTEGMFNTARISALGKDYTPA